MVENGEREMNKDKVDNALLAAILLLELWLLFLPEIQDTLNPNLCYVLIGMVFICVIGIVFNILGTEKVKS